MALSGLPDLSRMRVTVRGTGTTSGDWDLDNANAADIITNPLVSTLVDDFGTAADTALWDFTGTTVTGGQLRLDTATEAEANSDGTFTLNGTPWASRCV